jgi:hypothetical protein
MHLTKTDGGTTVQLHAFLMSALHGREWSPRTGRCSLQEKASVNHGIGGWLSLTEVMDALHAGSKTTITQVTDLVN